MPKNEDVALMAFHRGFGEYYKKEWERAVQDFDHALALDRSLLHSQVGKALSAGIRHQQSTGITILRDVETKIEKLDVGDAEAAYKIAQAYALLGDKSSALRVLRYSVEKGFFPYPYLLADPSLRAFAMRSNSRN